MVGNSGADTPGWMWSARISAGLLGRPMLGPPPKFTLPVPATLMSPLTSLPLMVTGFGEVEVVRMLPLVGSVAPRIMAAPAGVLISLVAKPLAKTWLVVSLTPKFL